MTADTKQTLTGGHAYRHVRRCCLPVSFFGKVMAGFGHAFADGMEVIADDAAGCCVCRGGSCVRCGRPCDAFSCENPSINLVVPPSCIIFASAFGPVA